MVNIEEIKDNQRCDGIDGFIHYSVAKREGIRKGMQFSVELAKGISHTFLVGEYITWRKDICRPFAGFEIREVKKN